ncbi:MAG TPA: hypothetical protein VH682_26780 [Gemmataceae bacterium]|jgi:hypothetical protein
MGRFILRFTAGRTAPDSDLERIRATPEVTVLDSSSPRMLLVQAPLETVRQLAEAMPGWTYSPEQTIPLPDPRPKVRSP